MDELLSRVRIKLWRSLRLYDAGRGSAFSFCAKIISSTAASMVGEAWNRSETFCSLDEETSSALCDPITTNDAIADIEARVRMLRTPCMATDVSLILRGSPDDRPLFA